MSNALAIAAVTAVLRDLLDNAVIDNSVSTAVGGRVKVTSLPPDRVTQEGTDAEPQINIFLYNVTQNQGWRNVGLPSRDDRGNRLTNQPLALDLYYLLTAYAKQDFGSEILLGYAMQTLHEMPVLSRDVIRRSLEPTSPIDDDLLPPAAGDLSASDLAEQVELIKITPHQLNIEEISKLWSAFQTNYRQSVAYHVSVVLIESKYQTKSPLPVLTRGTPDPFTGRDRGIISQPSLLPPFPALQEVIMPKRQNAARMGEVLTFKGHHLGGDEVMVRLTHVRSSRTLVLDTFSATPAGFQFQIPPDPASGPVLPDSPLNPDNWEIGLYSIAAVIQRADQQEATNELSIALAPLIKSIDVTDITDDVVTLTVKCSPKVWKTQTVTLVIGDREINAESITLEKTDTLIVKSANLTSGGQWVRLRVDGVESILIDKSGSFPEYDPAQKVEIP